MALNNTTADALATSYCASAGITGADVAKTKTFFRALYAALKTDVQITIAAAAIVTTGSATTQTGPPAPININPN